MQSLLDRAVAAKLKEQPAKDATQHLAELKSLYEKRKNAVLENFAYGGLSDILRPPLKEFYSFVDDLIEEKKRKIRREIL